MTTAMAADRLPASILHSPLLAQVGVPHGFTTRLGGVSGGVFESFNFGNPSDLPPADRDPPANIHQNWARLLGHLHAAGREVVQVHQVHGDAVHVVHLGGPSHIATDGHNTKADAIVCDDPARVVGIRVADCCPVLLSTADGSLVAAVHAGWRGVIADVLTRTVEAMVHVGAIRPREIVAAIGPCIGPDTFEVGAEVAEQFRVKFGSGTSLVAPHSGGQHTIDLKAALREQLLGAGVLGSMVDTRSECTVSAIGSDGRPLFFSHRRDRGLTGRMVGVIGPVRS